MIFIVVTIVMITIIRKYNNESILFTEINYKNIDKLAEEHVQCNFIFYSKYCATCQTLKKNLYRIQGEYDRENVYGVNIDNLSDSEVDELLKKYNVRGIPFVVHYENAVKKEVLYEDIKLEDLKRVFSENSLSSKLLIVYFFSPTCIDCEKISRFLNDIEISDNNVSIQKYNITSSENMSLYSAYCKEYQIKGELENIVPVVFVRNQYMCGSEDILKKTRDTIYQSNDVKTRVPNLTNGNTSFLEKKFVDMKIFEIIGMALINGLNPCSISMLIFFVGLLEEKPKKIFQLGTAFCVGKFIMLTALGTVVYKILSLINTVYIAAFIDIIMIMVAFILGILNIIDYYNVRSEKLGDIKVQLPKRIRKFNHKTISNTYYKFKKSSLRLAIFGIIGSMIAATEFLCSGQIYLLSIVSVIHTKQMFLVRAIAYLVIYNFFCILPLELVIVLVSKGKKSQNLSLFFGQKLHYIKLLYACLFFCVGIILLVQRIY